MAARRTSKAKPEAAEQAEAKPEATPVVHAGWDHDWRNPEAVFAADDHCADAELSRQDPDRR